MEWRDVLRRNGSPQSRNFAAALASLQPVDTCPLADVIAVGRAALEQFFFQTGKNRLFRAVLLSIGVASREADIEPGSFKQPFFDRNDQRRSEEHTSELQSPCNLVCRLLLDKK